MELREQLDRPLTTSTSLGLSEVEAERAEERLWQIRRLRSAARACVDKILSVDPCVFLRDVRQTPSE